MFCHVGHVTKAPLFPEVRYSVYHADGRGLLRSRLLQAGEYMPMEIRKGEQDQTIDTPHDRLDYQTVVIDPADDRTVWMISEFADQADPGESSDGYRTVVGKVTP
jgi:hypothetical protein